MMPEMKDQMEDAMGKKKPMVAIGVKVQKNKPLTFQPPKGWSSDNDDEVKEAVLKFKENPDGTCEMISLDGAPFKDSKNEDQIEENPNDEMEETQEGEEMPPDMPMEDHIKMLQKRDRAKY